MRGHPAVMTKWLLILSFVLLIDPSFLNVKSEKSISSRMRSKVSQPIILASKLVLLSQITQIAKLPIPANAVEIDDIDILKARIINKDYSMFRPGKQNGDIFYPPW